MSSLPRVPLGAREVTLGRNLAPLVCYYRIKLPFKAEPVLSGLHTIQEHPSFPTAPTHFLLLCLHRASPLPALRTARGTQMGGNQKRASRLFSHPWKVGSKGKRPLSREGELFWLWGMWGRRSRKQARAGSSGSAGGAGCGHGKLGISVVPPEKGQGCCLHCSLVGDPFNGTDCWFPLGNCCAQQGGGVRLAPISPRHESSSSSASPANVQPERGLASPLSSSFCPWWSQIQGTPPSPVS